MLARFADGPAEGLVMWLRGNRDYRPGAGKAFIAIVVVFEADMGGTVVRVPVEFPDYPERDLLNAAGGKWSSYWAPGDSVVAAKPEGADEDWRPAPMEFRVDD